MPYALSQCSESEADALETHLLECDACFEDLTVLDRAGAILAEHLGGTGKHAERIRKVLRQGVARVDSASGARAGSPSDSAPQAS